MAAYHIDIDSHLPGDSYQLEKQGGGVVGVSPQIAGQVAIFNADAAGAPFAQQTEYRIWKERTDPADPFRVCFTFRFAANGQLLTGEETIVEGDAASVDIDLAARNGNVTGLPLYFANAILSNVPLRNFAGKVAIFEEVDGGVRFAIAPLSELIQQAQPVYECDGFYKPVARNTTPLYVCDGYYAPVSPGTPLQKPGKPISPAFTKATGTDAVFTWDLVDGRETSVQVRLSNPDGSWGAIIPLSARVESIPFAGLGYGVTRTAQSRALNAAGESDWSDPATVRFNRFTYQVGLYTPAATPVLIGPMTPGGEIQRPPGNINIGVIIRGENNTVPTAEDFDRTIFNVIAPDGSLIGWTSFDPQSGPSAGAMFVTARPSQLAGQTGLYRVEIKLAKGNDQPVDSLAFLTRLLPPAAAPAAPTQLSAIRQSNGDIALSWKDNADNEDLHRVFFRQTGENNWIQLAVLPANSTAYPPFGGLNPAQSWEFYVSSENEEGHGDSLPVTLNASGPALPVITQVRVRKLDLGGGELQVEFEAQCSPADTAVWRFSVNSAENLTDSFPTPGQPGYGSLLTFPHTGETPDYTLYLAVRPVTNPGGIKSKYSYQFTGGAGHDWQTLTAS